MNNVNVLDFGADPRGVADSAQAFLDALTSFGPTEGPINEASAAGTVQVDPGIYRFAFPVRVKKSAHIRGSSGASPYLGTWIKPDRAIEAFVFEQYNTPGGTANTGSSSGGSLSGLLIQPDSKCEDWLPDTGYLAGDRRRTGTGVGEDWYRHYECLENGRSATTGLGPRGFTDNEQDGSCRWKYLGSGAGVRMRANGVGLRHLQVSRTSGIGVMIEAGGETPEGPACNANSWKLDDVHIWVCDGHGLFVNGGDSNAGRWIGGTAYMNGGATSGDEDYTGVGFNIYESSFLANYYAALELGTGGVGSVFHDSTLPSTFNTIYIEGTGGGLNDFATPAIIIGRGLAEAPMTARSNPVVLTATGGRNLIQALLGYDAVAWRKNVFRGMGARCGTGGNSGNVYEVVVPGITANEDGAGPRGTGTEIPDGACVWKFVHAVTPGGDLALGSGDPELPNYLRMRPTRAIDAVDYTVLKQGDFGDLKNALGFAYGLHGTGVGGESGFGIAFGLPTTTLLIGGTHPQKIPSGRPVLPGGWIDGKRVFSCEGEPTVGTYNPGDEGSYVGAACVAGGREGIKCTKGGTAGIYTGGRSCDSDGTGYLRISGGSMGPYVDQFDFQIGAYLTINGITARVYSMSDDGLLLGMNAVIPAGAELAIAFSNPTWREFGDIASDPVDPLESAEVPEDS